MSHPSTPYKPAKRIAEIFIKRSNKNKWLLYISRIGFFNPADTLNDYSDDIVVAAAKNPSEESSERLDETLDSADKFNLYIDQARLEEKKRNYQTAIDLYSRQLAWHQRKEKFLKPG